MNCENGHPVEPGQRFCGGCGLALASGHHPEPLSKPPGQAPNVGPGAIVMNAGWYPDPKGGESSRYWDGAAWAEGPYAYDRRNVEVTSPTGPASGQTHITMTTVMTNATVWWAKKTKWAKVFIGCLAVVVLIAAATTLLSYNLSHPGGNRIVDTPNYKRDYKFGYDISNEWIAGSRHADAYNVSDDEVVHICVYEVQYPPLPSDVNKAGLVDGCYDGIDHYFRKNGPQG